MDQRRDDYLQRIVAGTVVHDRQLEIAGKIFPELNQQREIDEGGVYFPKTDDEFEAMAEIYRERLELTDDAWVSTP